MSLAVLTWERTYEGLIGKPLERAMFMPITCDTPGVVGDMTQPALWFSGAVRVNAILPGGVETPIWREMLFFKDLVELHGSEAAAFQAMTTMATPLGRYAKADEVAAQIVHLLSDESAMITGAALVMDGGYSL